MREKQREAGRTHYGKHKEKVKAKVQAYKAKKKEEWQTFKRSLACIKCGAKHPAVIDFHHVNRKDPNKRKVYKLVQNQNYKAAYEEVKKCMVLCANCHRILHYEEIYGPDKPELCTMVQSDKEEEQS